MVPSEQDLLTRRRLRALPAALLLLFLAAACGPEIKRYVPNVVDGNTTPTMATTDVSTLISDSGYTRYHLVAPLWQMFEDSEDPFWRFPLGVDFEQYDLEMNPTANVVADSAVYFSRRRLWRLDGNVVIVNTQADSFLTQQLFWDQNERKIYTDSFIHIVRSDRIIEGYGMESDQSMTAYTVMRPTAILPAERRVECSAQRAESTTTTRPTRPAPAPAPTRPAPAKADATKADVAQPTAAPADSTSSPSPRKRLKLQKS